MGIGGKESPERGDEAFLPEENGFRGEDIYIANNDGRVKKHKESEPEAVGTGGGYSFCGKFTFEQLNLFFEKHVFDKKRNVMFE
jgi:hypothetical protein